MAWAASVGEPDNYVVMEARNGESYAPVASVQQTSFVIEGRAGDEVQIIILASGTNGITSSPSPPSPIIRFHAADVGAATAARPETSGAVATPTEPAPDEGQANEAATETTSPESAQLPSDETGAASEGDSASEGTTALDASLRAALLGSDARLPLFGLSEAASDWLRARIGDQGVTGVELVGVGHRDTDGESELVWRNPEGHLLVSDGVAAVHAEALSSTLEEAIRLGETERFIGLADLDGDDRGDWLIEDTATGDVWLIDDTTHEARPALEATGGPTLPRLVGQGDFDGDGVTELLWQSVDDDALFLDSDRPHDEEGSAPTRMLGSIPPERLLLIADLDGDGRDDLVSTDGEGRLELTSIASDATGALLPETIPGPTIGTDGLELLASLDLDRDGGAEIVWLDGDVLEIWDPYTGPLGDTGQVD